MRWTDLPVTPVPIADLVWPCHDIDPAHTHPEPGAAVSDGPIHVERLATGHLFIHDGRHRAIRARLAGHRVIDARVLP